MRRRDILRMGWGGAALAFLGKACKSGSKPSTPNPGEPDDSGAVYELTPGSTLYDDFDGHGNFQTFDGQELAAAGMLSSKIWGGTFGTEMLTYPVPGRPLAVVDENGRRFEYGPPDPAAAALQDYLRRYPRPVTALEKAILDKILNDRGQAAAAGLEASSLETQAKVLGYLLARRREVLNDRGRALAAFLSDTSAGTTGSARPAGFPIADFDETERAILEQLASEISSPGRPADSPLRTSLRSESNRIRAAAPPGGKYQDIAYVFDEEGRLVDAFQRAAGQPYPSSRGLFFRGAADRLLDTPAGPVRLEKGKIYGTAETVPAAPGGYILKVTNALQLYIKILPSNPEILDFPEFKYFSADVMLSSASTGPNCAAGLDFHTTIPEQPPGKSWWAQIVIVHGVTGETFLLGQYTNINLGLTGTSKLGPAELDAWYNLRMDVVTPQDDIRLRADEIRLDFYVDGDYKASLYPEDSPILLDRQRTGLGPHRTLVVYSENGSANAVGCFDNVRGVYKNRIR